MFPIKTKELLCFLPHRYPMIWIDEVLYANESRGVCLHEIQDTLPYWNEGKILASAGIEWIAQTIAFSIAAREYCKNKETQKEHPPLQKAFLAGLKDFYLEEIPAHSGQKLQIEMEIIREIPPFTLVKGSLQLEGKSFCGGVLKLFGTY